MPRFLYGCRQGEKNDSLSQHKLERNLWRMQNGLKKQCLEKKKKNNQKPRSHKSERLLITHKASRNVCQHVHLCTHPCTHQLHKYKHTELLPTAMLFLFFNATVFFNSEVFLSKIAIKNSNTIRILFFCADKKQMLEIYSSTLQFLIRLGFQQV